MTKTCLRLLFFAAAAWPLVHGCSDSSIECLGTPVACDHRDLGECNGGGCEVHAGCLGESVTCDSLTDRPNLCLQTGDCRYVGSCAGEAGCSQVAFDVCADTPGCVQVRRCYGGSVTCGSLADSQCELYPQCQLGQECRGSATDCGDLDSRVSCLQAPGCFSADTEPSVVD
jgi:hypothetical protein